MMFKYVLHDCTLFFLPLTYLVYVKINLDRVGGICVTLLPHLFQKA